MPGCTILTASARAADLSFAVASSRLTLARRGDEDRVRGKGGRRSGADDEGLGRSCPNPRCISEDCRVFAIMLRDLDGWKENRVNDGNVRSVIAKRVGVASIGEDVVSRRSSSTKEGSVIVDTSTEGFGLPSKDLSGGVTFPTKDVGELRDEG